MIKLSSIINFLETLAPPAFAESYDNVGLIIGNEEDEVHQALVCLDCTEEVLNDAIARRANLIIAHHPIIFNGIKKITGKTYVERIIAKAIQHQINIYALHTNLDNVAGGVSFKMAEMLHLENISVLDPKTNLVSKLIVYSPVSHTEQVLNGLFQAGAGTIGNYSECSFRVNGIGTFKPNISANPFVGTANEQHQENEDRIEVIFPNHLQKSLLMALRANHPYEEIAYDIIPLSNAHHQVGSGAIGYLPQPLPLLDFLKKVKQTFHVEALKYTPATVSEVHKVALCGGSGSFLLSKAIGLSADVFISSDFTYHKFFDAENKIVIADIGHYESEQFTMELIIEEIQKKFPTFAIQKTKVNTNPINYL